MEEYECIGEVLNVMSIKMLEKYHRNGLSFVCEDGEVKGVVMEELE